MKNDSFEFESVDRNMEGRIALEMAARIWDHLEEQFPENNVTNNSILINIFCYGLEIAMSVRVKEEKHDEVLSMISSHIKENLPEFKRALKRKNSEEKKPKNWLKNTKR